MHLPFHYSSVTDVTCLDAIPAPFDVHTHRFGRLRHCLSQQRRPLLSLSVSVRTSLACREASSLGYTSLVCCSPTHHALLYVPVYCMW